MPVLQIEYDVSDFGGWKAVFDRDPLGRATHGGPATGAIATPTIRTGLC